MAEYVARKAAIEALKKDVMGGLNYESILKNIPSADVQPVVRCINCKYYEGLACCKLIGDCGGTNWFCGWGEPKEGT